MSWSQSPYLACAWSSPCTPFSPDSGKAGILAEPDTWQSSLWWTSIPNSDVLIESELRQPTLAGCPCRPALDVNTICCQHADLKRLPQFHLMISVPGTFECVTDEGGLVRAKFGQQAWRDQSIKDALESTVQLINLSYWFRPTTTTFPSSQLE